MQTMELPVWILIVAGIALVLLGLVGAYRKRETLRYYYTLARGRPVEEKYLVYEAEEYDKKNAPRKKKKASLIGNLLFGIFMGTYFLIFILLFINPELLMPILMIAGSFIVGLEAWRQLRAYYELKCYGPAMHLQMYYQTLDGRENDLFLDNIVVSDRLTIRPLELVTATTAAEHVIRSGIDERRITAQTTKKYLTEEIRTKLEELDRLAEMTDKTLKSSISAMDFIRRYFDLEEDSPRATIPEPVQKILDEIGVMVRSLEVESGGSVNPADIVWHYFNADAIESELKDIELWKQGIVTPALREKLKATYSKARELDERLVEIFKRTDIIKRYFGVGIPRWAGEEDNLPRYQPHIYTIYPNRDLRRRCVLIFPVPFGEAIKTDAHIKVTFDYTEFTGLGAAIETIRVGTLSEILLKGAEVQCVPIELPEGMFAVSTDVPVFVVTSCDYTDELARRGLRQVRPPAEVSMFAQVVKSIEDRKGIMGKLSKALREIARLKQEDEEEKIIKETERAEAGLDVGPLIDPSRLPTREVKVEVPWPRWKQIALVIVGVVLGMILLYVALKQFGFVIIDSNGNWV